MVSSHNQSHQLSSRLLQDLSCSSRVLERCFPNNFRTSGFPSPFLISACSSKSITLRHFRGFKLVHLLISKDWKTSTSFVESRFNPVILHDKMDAELCDRMAKFPLFGAHRRRNSYLQDSIKTAYIFRGCRPGVAPPLTLFLPVTPMPHLFPYLITLPLFSSTFLSISALWLKFSYSCSTIFVR